MISTHTLMFSFSGLRFSRHGICILLLFLFVLNGVQAQFDCRGWVRDSDGKPMAGAWVRVKGTDIGTTTDFNGAFSILSPQPVAQLLIGFTGYKEIEMEWKMGMEITAILTEGIELQEVMVTALGLTRLERSLGYSVEKLKSDELQDVPQANFVSLLSGKIAGLAVIGSNGGNLGGSARLTLRGVRSINGDNQPLFVVDGVPLDNSNFTNFAQVLANGSGMVYESQRDYGNAIQDLSVDDIESFHVLKGPASAALYGSRGSNGVIMITTKSAVPDNPGVGISVNTGITFDNVAVFPKFQRKYGGGGDLLPKGYADGTGYYKIPYLELDGEGDTLGIFQSFDLVPIYGVDESNGTRFEITTNEHFSHLDGLTVGDQNRDRFVFLNGYGADESGLYYRNWNSWDAWDQVHFGRNIPWRAGDNPRTFFKTGLSTRFNIAFEKYSDLFQYRLSYTRFVQSGIYPNSLLGRHQLAFNGGARLNQRLSVNLSAHYLHSDNKGRSASTYDFRGGFNPGQNFSQWWQTQLRFDDLRQYQNPDGTMRTWNRQAFDNPRPQYWDNPYWSRYKNFATDGRDRLFGHIALSYKFRDWLTLTGRILNDQYNELREERIADGSLLQSQYTRDLYHVRETNADLILRAEGQMGSRFFMNGFLGANKLWRTSERNFGATTGGLNVPGIYRLQNSKERPYVLNYLTQRETESFFGGIGFSWNRIWYLDLTGRQDWSSTLPNHSNAYFYPSASMSFVFSESVDIPGVSFGKLRLSWAQVGGDSDPYSIYTTYFGNPNFGDLPNFTVSNTLNNDQLKPEQTRSLEAGLDLRFMQSRFGLDLSIYSTSTRDQIIPLATSAATGFTRQFVNAGEIRNRGIELILDTRLIERGDFGWISSFNFGRNFNKVVSILPEDPSIENIPLAFPGGGISINAFRGQAYGTIFGSNYIFDEKGNRLVDPGTGYYLVSPGVMPIGNINPDFTGGWLNQWKWKNISFQVLVDFRKGGDIFSVTNLWGRYSGLLRETAENGIRENGYVFDGILAVLDSKGQPILMTGGSTASLEDDRYQGSGQKNSRSVSYGEYKYFAGGFHINKQDLYDGSFVKLREIQLAYKFSGSWLNSVGIREASFGLTARNLWILFKNIPHIDPEIAVSTNNIQGNEGGATPSTRSWGFNLQFKF